MLENSSVAVLADCTDLYNNDLTLTGLNGPPSFGNIENETILTDNTDISPSQALRSVSFQERVQSTESASVFPLGRLKQKIKEKKSTESSQSNLPLLENDSSLKSITEPDKNVSAGFEINSKNKEEFTKPFNKNLYLKNKSVNIPLDSNSLSEPIAEKYFEANCNDLAESFSKEATDIQNINNGTSNQNKLAISNSSEIGNDAIGKKENIESAREDDDISTINSSKKMNESPVELDCCVRNVRNKGKKSGNHTDKLGDSVTKNISINSDSNSATSNRFMYHSTPISRVLGKKNGRKLKLSCNVKLEDENVQQDNKMIQVSKSLLTSSDVTLSKKESIEISNSSSLINEKSNGRKQLNKMESIGKTRSYHSDFISSLEDNNILCSDKKSVKRLAFKSIASNENSSGYQNSSDNCASRNIKSVGFRNAISLIEYSVCENSEGDLCDAINSVHDVPDTVNDSNSSQKKSKNLSLNHTAEVPECNESSEECTLLNKLFEMAGNEKSGSNAATRRTKQPRARNKFRNLNLVRRRAMADSNHREKWVSPNLLKFLNNKLMTDALDHIINTERIVSILCSVVSAVRKLKDVSDIDFTLLPLKNILFKFRVCCNMIEYYTFISRFTPFEFQRKVAPLEGYFGSCKRGIKRKLTDPILTEDEKIDVFS